MASAEKAGLMSPVCSIRSKGDSLGWGENLRPIVRVQIVASSSATVREQNTQVRLTQLGQNQKVSLQIKMLQWIIFCFKIMSNYK